MMKTCMGCNGQVSSKITTTCPLCGESKNFSSKIELFESATISDTVGWEGDITQTTTSTKKSQKRSIVELIIMIVSITIAGSFKLELEGHTPFVMLIVFFLSAIISWWDDIITKTKERVHMSSKE